MANDFEAKKASEGIQMKKACFILLAAAALAAGVFAWNAMDKAAGKEAAVQAKRDEDFAKWRKAVDAAHENWRDRAYGED